jgi:hypothetical protein
MKYAVLMASDDMIHVQNFTWNFLWHYGNIQVITLTICEATALILLIREIYDERRYDLMWHDIYFFIYNLNQQTGFTFYKLML